MPIVNNRLQPFGVLARAVPSLSWARLRREHLSDGERRQVDAGELLRDGSELLSDGSELRSELLSELLCVSRFIGN